MKEKSELKPVKLRQKLTLWWMLVKEWGKFGLIGIYRISIIMGYSMPKPFYAYKQLYLKRFSLA